MSYEYNVTAIKREYDFDLDKGLPFSSVSLGEGSSIPVKALMIWRALTCDYYNTQVVADANAFAYVISYYDMYEVPTCYRKVILDFVELNQVKDVVGNEVAKACYRGDFNHSTFLRELLCKYLEALKLVRPHTPNWKEKIVEFVGSILS